MRFDLVTTFPEMFGALPGTVLGTSIPARARAAGIVDWHAHDIRTFTNDKHQKTDDRPFGGGPGMVMMAQPVYDCVLAAEASDPRPATRVVMTPQGERLSQALVEEFARLPRVLIIAGHYEGIDERVLEVLRPREVSIGDYVLSGGELGALVLMDAVIRLLPGALGHEDSAAHDSFSVARSYTGVPGTPRRERIEVPEGTRLLDCPHYTKPREWMGRSVPEVLLSGDHGAIERWRLQQRIERTRTRGGG